MNDLSIFAFGDCMIRTIKKDDETWFVGRDVATALEYAKPENALATHVDNDDKRGCPISIFFVIYRLDPKF